MGIIYVARHGQDQDNADGLLNGRRNTPLTALGRRQSFFLAQSLRNKGIDVILSTPLLRGYETAETARLVLGLGLHQMIVVQDLIEQDFGALTGTPLEDLTRVLPTPKSPDPEIFLYLLKVAGAEPWENVQLRAGRVLQLVAERYGESNVLLVCHRGIGKMIETVYHGRDYRKALVHNTMDNCSLIELTKPENGRKKTASC